MSFCFYSMDSEKWMTFFVLQTVSDVAQKTTKVIEDAKPIASSAVETILSAAPITIVGAGGALFFAYLLFPPVLSAISFSLQGCKGKLVDFLLITFISVSCTGFWSLGKWWHIWYRHHCPLHYCHEITTRIIRSTMKTVAYLYLEEEPASMPDTFNFFWENLIHTSELELWLIGCPVYSNNLLTSWM